MKFITMLIALFLLVCSPCVAAENMKLSISGQPAMHGMPTWENMRNGSLEKAGLDAKLTLFTSGSSQIEAFAAGQWDIGSLGTIPPMLAGLRYGAQVIAIVTDDSKTNDLWVRPDSPILKTKGYNPKFPEIYGTPDDWRGKKILCATMTSGHYVVMSTLKALGLTENDVQIVQVEQGQSMAAFTAGEGDIIQLFTPANYVGESRGWKRVSSGYDAGVYVPTVLMVNKQFAEKFPEVVATWLDLYIRVYDDLAKDKEKGVALALDYFTNYCGVPLTKEQLDKDFDRRIFFTLEENYASLSDPNKLPAWMGAVAQFMADGKRITPKELARYKASNSFVEPKFLKMVIDRRVKAATEAK